MSQFHRDLQAAGHVNAATQVGKQINIIDKNVSTIFTGLYAVVREMSKKEALKFGAMAMVTDFDKVIEIARQVDTLGAQFTTDLLLSKRDTIQYGSLVYQIDYIMTEDSEILTGGAEDAAVATCFCKVMRPGVGELPR